ncbi:hypothetical protein ABKA04_005923 [Annulohypoxylon sp. FPYF3050]
MAAPVAPASIQYRVKEVQLTQLDDRHLTEISSWIARNAKFSPYEQIRRSLLPGSTPLIPCTPTQGNEFEIEVTGQDGANIYGLAWLSVWNNTLLAEPVNEEFMDPSRDHNDYINRMLLNETPYATHRRQGFYVEAAKALRNRRFAQFQGNLIQLRDIILSAQQPAPEVLRILIKCSIEVANSVKAPLITTLPRLYLEINHELDQQGFRVVGTEKYPFLCLNSHGMRLAEVRYPNEDMKDIAMFLRQVPCDVMLKIYDKAATPDVKNRLAQLGLITTDGNNGR